MSEYLDLDRLWELAVSAPALGCPLPPPAPKSSRGTVKIGIIRDSAFQFYYPENFQALEDRGASIVWISSLENAPLPEVDALYIGGGFPETHLEKIAENKVFRDSVKSAVEAGLPVYAECGGLMFLCRGIRQGEKLHPMVGVFPFEIILEAKPQGHGYTIMECVNANPFFPKSTTMRGHEFHYSRIAGRIDPGSCPFVFRLKKGHGIVAGWDGLCYKNVLACYSHLHAAGNEHWGDAMIAAAGSYTRFKTSISACSGLDRVRPESPSFPTPC
jgi:cobyrinic acid a,c-diamide synthase